MRKLTDKIKFSIDTDEHGSSATLYAKYKVTGKFMQVGTCHLSVLDYIREHGLKSALDAGLIRWTAA